MELSVVQKARSSDLITENDEKFYNDRINKYYAQKPIYLNTLLYICNQGMSITNGEYDHFFPSLSK